MKVYLFPSKCIKVLQENYYNIDSYLVQTRSQVRCDGIKTPRSSWHEKEFRSKHKTRKTTYQFHKRKCSKAAHRSG